MVSGGAVIVAEESVESCATTDRGVWRSRRCGCNQPTLDALVTPLAMVVGLELGQSPSQAGINRRARGGPGIPPSLSERTSEPGSRSTRSGPERRVGQAI